MDARVKTAKWGRTLEAFRSNSEAGLAADQSIQFSIKVAFAVDGYCVPEFCF